MLFFLFQPRSKDWMDEKLLKYLSQIIPTSSLGFLLPIEIPKYGGQILMNGNRRGGWPPYRNQFLKLVFPEFILICEFNLYSWKTCQVLAYKSEPSEWPSLVAVGHACQYNCFVCFSPRTNSEYISAGLHFLNLKWVSICFRLWLLRWLSFSSLQRWSYRYWSSRSNLLRRRKKYIGRWPVSCHR